MAEEAKRERMREKRRAKRARKVVRKKQEVGEDLATVLRENDLMDGHVGADDLEIEYLERKLGLHKKKNKARGSMADALEETGLGGLGRVVDEMEGGASDDDLNDDDDVDGLAGVFAEAMEEEGDVDDVDLVGGEEGSDGDEDNDGAAVGTAADADDDDDDDESGVDEDGGRSDTGSQDADAAAAARLYKDTVRQRVDLYGRDVRPGGAGKYVPPHLRARAGAADGALRTRLRGLLNRLGEANVEPLSRELEDMFRSNSRRDMLALLTDTSMALCTDQGGTAFEAVCRCVSAAVAALHICVGPEVGSHFVEHVALAFVEEVHREREASKATKGAAQPSQRASSLLVLLAFQYTHGVTQARLPLDVGRELADALSEVDVELLLTLLRIAGFKLRADDPAGLGDLFAHVQTSAESKDLSQAPRMRFMLETIADLRHNRRRRADEDAIEREKRLLKWLQRLRSSRTGTGGADAALRFGLDDLRAAETRGRWWVPGAKFEGTRLSSDANAGGAARTAAPSESAAEAVGAVVVPDLDTQTVSNAKLLQLARAQHMNTDIRRSVFCAVMGASDFLDANERILQLNLTDRQAREVPRVVLHCCGQERGYNPFYAHILSGWADQVPKHKFSLQLALWDNFKLVPQFSTRRAANLARCLAHVIGTGTLTLATLKVVDFTALSTKEVLFYRLFMVALLSSQHEAALQRIAVQLSETKGVQGVRDGLVVFLNLNMGAALQDATVKRKAKILRKMLDTVAQAVSRMKEER